MVLEEVLDYQHLWPRFCLFWLSGGKPASATSAATSYSILTPLVALTLRMVRIVATGVEDPASEAVVPVA